MHKQNQAACIYLSNKRHVILDSKICCQKHEFAHSSISSYIISIYDDNLHITLVHTNNCNYARCYHPYPPKTQDIVSIWNDISEFLEKNSYETCRINSVCVVPNDTHYRVHFKLGLNDFDLNAFKFIIPHDDLGIHDIKLPSKKLNIFFDLDGVLNILTNYNSFFSDNPDYLKPNSNYFANTPMNPHTHSILYDLQRLYYHDKDNLSIYVITTIMNTNPKLETEHIKDKQKWFDKHFNNDNSKKKIKLIMVKGNTKSHVVKRILDRNLTSNDILIDDFNENLKDWQINGGKAIKYINGNNSPKSFAGPKFTKDMDVYQLIQLFGEDV